MSDGPLNVKLEVVSYKLCTPSTNVQSLLGGVVKLTGLEQLSQDAPHFVYLIRVTMGSPNSRTWDVSKRFSELAQLDRELSTMLRMLPAFPPKGAVRDLSDSCARDRMVSLNKYLIQLAKMDEVTTSNEFLVFFKFDASIMPMYGLKSIGKVQPMVNADSFAIAAAATRGDYLVTALNQRNKWTQSLGSYVSSFLNRSAPPPHSRVLLWSRLPNSLLYESIGACNTSGRITCVQLRCDQLGYVAGTAEGRVEFGVFKNNKGTFSHETGFLPGVVFVGSVTCMYVDSAGTFVWACGEDGGLIKFDLAQSSVEIRSSCNSESGVYGTSITVSEETGTLYIGLSNGVVAVYVPGHETMPLRQVTLLQGPPSAVTSLSLVGDVIYASHSAGVVDSVDGSNSVQPWNVANVLSRGSERLPPIGPFVCSCASVVEYGSGEIAVVSSNGTVATVDRRSGKLTNIFCVHESASALLHADGHLFVVGDSSIHIVSRNHSDLFHHSSTEMSACMDVGGPKHVPKQAMPRGPSSDEDDLASWARA